MSFEIEINFSTRDKTLLYPGMVNDIVIPIPHDNIVDIDPASRRLYESWRRAIRKQRCTVWHRNTPYLPYPVTNKLEDFAQFLTDCHGDVSSPEAVKLLREKETYKSWESLLPVDKGKDFPDTLAFELLKQSRVRSPTGVYMSKNVYMADSTVFVRMRNMESSLFRKSLWLKDVLVSEDNWVEVEFEFLDSIKVSELISMDFHSTFILGYHTSNAKEFAGFFESLLDVERWMKDKSFCHAIFENPVAGVKIHKAKMKEALPSIELYGYMDGLSYAPEPNTYVKRFNIDDEESRNKFFSCIRSVRIIGGGEEDEGDYCLPDGVALGKFDELPF